MLNGNTAMFLILALVAALQTNVLIFDEHPDYLLLALQEDLLAIAILPDYIALHKARLSGLA